MGTSGGSVLGYFPVERVVTMSRKNDIVLPGGSVEVSDVLGSVPSTLSTRPGIPWVEGSRVLDP